MVQNLKKKKIFLIFDALPFEHFKNYGYKYLSNIKRKEVIKLESLIGYSSGLYPSIWTGLFPDKVNYWTDFKFNSQKLINSNNINKSSIVKKILNILPFFPSKLSQIFSFFLFLLSYKLDIFPYHHPIYFDFKLYNFFIYEDYRQYIFFPEKTRNKDHKTLFSKLHENKISYKFIDTVQYIDDFTKFNEEIIFYYNPIMDIIGHKHGPKSKNYRKMLIQVFQWIDELIYKNEFNIILFSDHGMTEVKKKFYPLKLFQKLDLKLNKDLIVWLDSTMIRIWFYSQKALKLKRDLINLFNNTQKGHFLTELEKEKFGLNFNNRYFGDYIFLVNPYYEVFPNFFNINPFRKTPGLHGYIPTHKSSYGIFYSNFIDYQENLSLIDLYKIFIDSLNLS